jgi:hypothetical protein
LLAVVLPACGNGSQADPYAGFVDATPFDPRYVAATDRTVCQGNPLCYAPQQGYAKGQPAYFYNVGAAGLGQLPKMNATTAQATIHAFDFPHGCIVGPEFDERVDAYSQDVQYPIFDSLPLVAKPPVLPIVAVSGIEAQHGNICNDLKDTRSIAPHGPPGEGGKFGAQVSGTPVYRLWAIIDPTAPVLTEQKGAMVLPPLGWYRGLLLSYLDGGVVPFDPNGTGGQFAVMDGLLLQPNSGATQSKPTDPKVVLLPFVPGDTGYSPLVRLHNFILPAGKQPGDYTSICTGAPCADNAADPTVAQAAQTMLFIVGGVS